MPHLSVMKLAARRDRRFTAVAAFCRRLAKNLFDPYRPERHYMRGPGPKWHAKHRLDAPIG